ncbi:peptidyl-tRNA hydrolase [Pedobacter soli]|uniref:Peptidyl-tRNA hydrolase PTH2 n=1 Tax=Pedobacter soli TaxID=390242 RepID=A0A1G7AGD4_9SPHI|nr:peptidyl-tRNA hydrolase [Pedobacter soli]SDE13800.1 Peptidyl-tRNA hydrolase PTH2 [Pedobacter soli]
MKMYILVKRAVPDKMVPLVAAHASLACFRKFEHTANMQTWINGIFKKVVCVVSEKEFENAKKEADHLVLTESALDNQEVCIAFSPREEYTKMFKFFSMWTPQNN